MNCFGTLPIVREFIKYKETIGLYLFEMIVIAKITLHFLKNIF